MNNQASQLNSFLSEVKSSQCLWALKDPSTDEWVVADSELFEDADVIPLWSSQARAQACCVDVWIDYVPTEISLSDWFEFWVDDLGQDGVMVGVNWQADLFEEMELPLFAEQLADVETY